MTPDIQAAMMNDSDIMVAVPNGSGGWNVTNLNWDDEKDKSNGVGDLAPVVARQGDNILVAWRQVASGNAADVTDFNLRDYVYYAASTDGGTTWSDPLPIFNGTTGSVKGLEAAMLPDGTAAVAFSLQGEGQDLMNKQYDQDVVYAVVGKQEGVETYDVLHYTVLTDEELSENPQLAAVKLDESTDAFILGWHSLAADASAGDIRLAAIDGEGNRITGFVDSLSNLVRNAEMGVSADFQFVQNAATLDDLSVLWSDTVMGDATIEEEQAKPTHDCINGLRFRTVLENGVPKVSVTAAQRLVEMEDWTSVDSFSTYVKDGEVYTVSQGTYYDYENMHEIPIEGRTEPVYVAQEKTNIYTSVGGYTDTVRLDDIIPDYAHAVCGKPRAVTL